MLCATGVVGDRHALAEVAVRFDVVQDAPSVTVIGNPIPDRPTLGDIVPSGRERSLVVDERALCHSERDILVGSRVRKKLSSALIAPPEARLKKPSRSPRLDSLENTLSENLPRRSKGQDGTSRVAGLVPDEVAGLNDEMGCRGCLDQLDERDALLENEELLSLNEELATVTLVLVPPKMAPPPSPT